MMYLLAAFILWKFDAGFIWWAGYGAVIVIQIYAIIHNATKEVKQSQLLKANGQPYTEADLEFIWKHGYQSAQEVINSTKQ